MTTTVKTCFKCNKTLPIEAFYQHKTMKDGLAVRPMKKRKRDKGQIDMDENQFWAVIWKCATVAFVVVVATLGSCSVHKQRVVEHMVEMGNDPIKAHCSMYIGDAENRSICAIVAMPK